MTETHDGEVDSVGYFDVSDAFGGAKITRDGISLRVVQIRSADVGYFLDVEVIDVAE